MSAPLEVLAVIGIITYVIGRQLIGEPLRGKRVVVLPAVLTVIGLLNLNSSKLHIGPADIACLVVGGVIVAAIGVAQASVMRLESRGGSLWGQTPVKGLWLWLVLVLSRVLMTVIADGVNAKAAAAGSAILFMLGVNRLAQAGIIVLRATSAGIPFAPEKDGKTLLAGLTNRPEAPAVEPRIPQGPSGTSQARSTQPGPGRATGIDWLTLARQASTFLESRHRGR